MKGLFVTATDTGVGKTTLLCQLIPVLEKAGLALRIAKPVESGCPIEDGRLIARDATALATALATSSSRKITPEQICTYRLRSIASPARAARLEDVELTIQKLADTCVAGVEDDDFLLVEGAGGLCSPIAYDGLNADLARYLELPLLIVVGDRLGCVNHAVLTVEAARHRNLHVVALVVNQNKSTRDMDTNNFSELSELKELTDTPIFKLSHVDIETPQTKQIATLARHILAWQNPNP